MKKSRLQIIVRHKDGQEIPVDISISPIDMDGRTHVIATMRDQTEHQEALAEIEEKKEYYRRYIANNTGSIWRLVFDEPMSLDLPEMEQVERLLHGCYLADTNLTFSQQYGYAEEGAMNGKRVEDILIPGDPNTTPMLLKMVRSRFQMVDLETIERDRYGNRKVFTNNFSADIVDGKVRSIWGTSHEITARKLAEEKLIKAEHKYRTVVENANEAIIVMQGEKIVYFNQQVLEMTGYGADEISSLPFIEFIHPNDRDKVMEELKLRISGEETIARYTIRFKTKDDESKWIIVNSAAIDWEGKPASLAMLTDITELKKTEKELRDTNITLLKVKEVAQVGFLNLDLKTDEIDFSLEACRIFGIETGQVLKVSEFVARVIHPDDMDLIRQHLDRAIQDKKKYDIDHRVVRSDGKILWVRSQAEMQHAVDGKPVALLGTVVDITRLKHAENEAREQRDALARVDRSVSMGQLTGSIAHELNQPLTAILCNAQAALRFMNNESPDFEEVGMALHDIISDDKRAGEIVHSIRNQMGKYDSNYTNLDFNETIREVLMLLKSEVINRKVLLSEDLQPDIPPVYGDRIQIQQLILNLLMNALEALIQSQLPTPEIIISSRFKDNKDVALYVKDSGPGIEPERISTIFNSFETTKKEGLGIGLSICQSISDNHRGKLWVENRPEGGAVFCFTLPTGVSGNE
jgi:PAS domain S-box-containing protein